MKRLSILGGVVTVLMAVTGMLTAIFPPVGNLGRLLFLAGFILLGGIGIYIVILQANKTEQAENERKQAEQERARMEQVVEDSMRRLEVATKQVRDDISALIAGPSGASVVVQEQQRQRNLYALLRREYILSNDGLSAAMIAGTEPLPKDWVNRRLGELGETWQV